MEHLRGVRMMSYISSFWKTGDFICLLTLPALDFIYLLFSFLCKRTTTLVYFDLSRDNTSFNFFFQSNSMLFSKLISLFCLIAELNPDSPQKICADMYFELLCFYTQQVYSYRTVPYCIRNWSNAIISIIHI